MAKSPLGRIPVLDTPFGSITESNAIARYVARLRQDTGLYGATFFESAQVDSWIDFTSHDIELSATVWFYPVLGIIPYNASAAAKAKVIAVLYFFYFMQQTILFPWFVVA